MRILAVDDNESCLRAIADVVRATGFELVGSARTGEEAVRLHDALRPDLVLLDVRLPTSTATRSLGGSARRA